MKNLFFSLLVGTTVTLCLASCTTTRYPGERRDDDRNGFPFPRSDRDRDKDDERKEKQRDRDQDGKEGEGKNLPFGRLGIPRGHLPPPGECKIWIPDRPAGQQGAPQSCKSALRSAPLGAWVITHEGGRYKVNIFNRTRRNVIDEVKYYLSE